MFLATHPIVENMIYYIEQTIKAEDPIASLALIQTAMLGS
jgi:hypothetical protein